MTHDIRQRQTPPGQMAGRGLSLLGGGGSLRAEEFFPEREAFAFRGEAVVLGAERCHQLPDRLNLLGTPGVRAAEGVAVAELALESVIEIR